MMAPPRKYTGQVSAFTYRCDTRKWRKFSAVATLLGRTPGSIFDDTVDEFLSKNKVTFDVQDEETRAETEKYQDTLATTTPDAEVTRTIESAKEGQAARRYVRVKPSIGD
jgi:hypothetical protein